MKSIDNKCVNAIRILSADMVQNANSGHPGLPLGAAPMAYELWTKYMHHSAHKPEWVNRDRFILSAGHGSAMLYSLLHLFGYGELSIDDLKAFRQLNSRTPGHPEYRHTIGVEATTGPLGAGMGMAVGMAIAEAHLSHVFNREGFPIINHFTYVLGGDGCMMEGISSEAFSLAGTLKLGKLIVFYDSNNISIEGSTDIAFTENVEERFKAFGFQTILVKDGNNLEELGVAIEQAQKDLSRPSLIICKTIIGYGCPQKEGAAAAHGEPLGTDNVLELRKKLNWKSNEPFFVPNDVYMKFKQVEAKNLKLVEEWDSLFASYQKNFPEMANLWNEYFLPDIHNRIEEYGNYWEYTKRPESTRNISGQIINKIKDMFGGFIGGSADLAPSTKTYMEGEGDFGSANYAGRNLHFGVRELSMAAIGNGIVLHGGLKAFVSTFFVFSDYVKPMARLSALMQLPLIYVFTHDSIGVGEDGPTHEPVEQLAMFRSMPNFVVYRPADAKETLASWYYACTSSKTPVALALTRQELPQLKNSSTEGTLKGGYVIEDSTNRAVKLIIIATGSEVALALKVKEKLETMGIGVRVVSMPSMDVFEKQSKLYKDEVMMPNIKNRVVIEAGVSYGWNKYVGMNGLCITMDSFGASGSAEQLFPHFGFTVEDIVTRVNKHFNFI